MRLSASLYFGKLKSLTLQPFSRKLFIQCWGRSSSFIFYWSIYNSGWCHNLALQFLWHRLFLMQLHATCCITWLFLLNNLKLFDNKQIIINCWGIKWKSSIKRMAHQDLIEEASLALHWDIDYLQYTHLTDPGA